MEWGRGKGESAKVVKWEGILKEYHIGKSEAHGRQEKILCLKPREKYYRLK